MASELSLPRPQTALTQLRELAIPADAPRDSVVQLIISVDDSAVNVREFSAYLNFIDRTYGRLTQGTLTRYSRRRGSQLQTSFRQGSLEVVMSDLLAHVDSVTALVVIRCALKYLPNFLTSSATAYRDYQEGAMVRERRKKLREEIKEDQELATLDKDKQNEIIAFLDGLYSSERRRLPAAKRFAAKYVQKVILKIVSEDESLK